MPRFGTAEISSVDVREKQLQSELPKDSQAVYEMLLNDPVIDTADMRVEGNWTYRAIANEITVRQFADGKTYDWDEFKQVKWSELKPGDSAPAAIVDFGNPAGVSAAFGTGDPGVGSVNIGNGYRVPGRAGETAVVLSEGEVIASAEPGDRAFAFNVSGGAEMVQLINQYDWGYQASVIGVSIDQLPTLGTNEAWAIPAYNTEDGNRSMIGAYAFNYNRVLGVALLRTSFDIKASGGGNYTFALRNTNGEVLASTDVSLNQGGNSVTINFVNAPPSGYVTVDSKGERFTVEQTSKSPPL